MMSEWAICTRSAHLPIWLLDRDSMTALLSQKLIDVTSISDFIHCKSQNKTWRGWQFLFPRQQNLPEVPKLLIHFPPSPQKEIILRFWRQKWNIWHQDMSLYSNIWHKFRNERILKHQETPCFEQGNLQTSPIWPPPFGFWFFVCIPPHS